jgi:hypothetical protein
MTKNLAYQQKNLEVSQEVFDRNTLKMEEVEEIDQPIHLVETRKIRA